MVKKSKRKLLNKKMPPKKINNLDEKSPQQLGVEYENYVFKKLKDDYPQFKIGREKDIKDKYENKPRALDFSLSNDDITIFIQCKFIKDKLPRKTVSYICETFDSLKTDTRKVCVIDATCGITSGCDHVIQNRKDIYVAQETNIKHKRKQYVNLKKCIDNVLSPPSIMDKIIRFFIRCN